MALLKRVALSLARTTVHVFESRVDSIAIILMDIKSEVADLILFKKRVESILPNPTSYYVHQCTSKFLATSSTYLD